jgi:hypothetical protein
MVAILRQKKQNTSQRRTAEVDAPARLVTLTLNFPSVKGVVPISAYVALIFSPFLACS